MDAIESRIELPPQWLEQGRRWLNQCVRILTKVYGLDNWTM